jgi:PAS domain S-box-containing protein
MNNGQKSSSSKKSNKTCRVLLVDDSQTFTLHLSHALRNHGYEVEVVNDGLEALDRVTTDPPEVVILDYFLPKIDGGRVAKYIKGMSLPKDISVIILSGAVENIPRNCIEAADAVIAKNRIELIIDSLDEVIGHLLDPKYKAKYKNVTIGLEKLVKRSITKKIHNLKHQISILYEAIGEAVFETDEYGKIINLNTKASELFDKPERDIVGSSLVEILQLSKDDPISCAIMNLLSDEENREQYGNMYFSINDRTFKSIISKLRMIDSKVHVLLVAEDITEREQAKVAKEKLEAQLYQADKMTAVGRLAAGIAHEINNPIGFVLPNLVFLDKQYDYIEEFFDFIEQGSSQASTLEFLNRKEMINIKSDFAKIIHDCIEGAKRIRDATRELRQFSRIDNVAEHVDLAELVNSSLTIATNEIRYRAKVIKQYSDIPKAYVNRGRMSQVYLNIIINAAHSIEEGHVDDNWIKVTTGQKNDMIFVEIANSGKQIPPQVLPNIFDPFYTTKPLGKGTGLGLSISYSIVQQHNGHIEVNSSKEETSFRIWLPAPKPKEKKDMLPTINRRYGLEDKAGGIQDLSPTKSARILIVDDEESILRYMRRFLNRANHSVVTAKNGREALDILDHDQEFDVVLCDLIMDEVSGMDLYEELKTSNPKLLNRFIFITGGAFTPRAKEFFTQIPNTKFEKPIDNSALLNAIQSLISLN